jgi:hypothetical protein
MSAAVELLPDEMMLQAEAASYGRKSTVVNDAVDSLDTNRIVIKNAIQPGVEDPQSAVIPSPVAVDKVDLWSIPISTK